MCSSERVRAQMLTWDEMQAGVACRACDRPWTGQIVPQSPEHASFDAEHQGGGRHVLAGEQIAHCLTCCPPPPLSPATIDRLADLLRAPTTIGELRAHGIRVEQEGDHTWVGR